MATFKSVVWNNCAQEPDKGLANVMAVGTAGREGNPEKEPKPDTAGDKTGAKVKSVGENWRAGAWIPEI